MALIRYFSWPGVFFCMTVLPFLLGKAALRITEGRQAGKVYLADAVLTGWILCIGTVEAVHLAAVFGGRSFSDAAGWLAGLFGLLFAAALGILGFAWYRAGGGNAGKRKKRGRMKRQPGYRPCSVFEIALFLGFVLLLVYQLVTAAAPESVYRTGDLTVETVESFIETDAFYQVNPLTGRAYEQGMPLRLKILCLPTLYGFLCRVSGLTGAELVWKLVPVVTLMGSYLVFHVLACIFFPKRGDRPKREIFMLFVAALFCIGDYRYGMDGFGLLYSGFRGVTIRNAVLLPYTFGLLLRRRWKTAALCVLAEACLVWTFYGMGACLLTVLIFFAVQKLSGKINRKETDSGKGAEAEWNC